MQVTETQKSEKPVNMSKRIGSTNYRVAIHFSRTSKETIEEKILRLIKNDVKRKGASE